MHNERDIRFAVALNGFIRQRGIWSNARIENISSHGMLLRTSLPVGPGVQIEIRRAAFSIAARVVWRIGDLLGVRTDEIIDCLALRLLPREAPHFAAASHMLDRPAQRARRATEDRGAADLIGLLLLAAMLMVAITAVAGAGFRLAHRSIATATRAMTPGPG